MQGRERREGGTRRDDDLERIAKELLCVFLCTLCSSIKQPQKVTLHGQLILKPNTFETIPIEINPLTLTKINCYNFINLVCILCQNYYCLMVLMSISISNVTADNSKNDNRIVLLDLDMPLLCLAFVNFFLAIYNSKTALFFHIFIFSSSLFGWNLI